MDSVLPLKQVYLFCSHARGEARPDSDVDLCLVAEGAAEQLKAAQTCRRASSSIRPKPAFTLVPISPRRLEEKRNTADFFFATVLRGECCLSRKTDANNPSDWLWMAEADFELVCSAADREVSFFTCRGKLAEVLEEVLKAELIRLGWALEKTHDLDRLLDELVSRRSDRLAAVEPLCDTLAEVYFTDRYPGFDFDDADWPLLREQISALTPLIATVKERVTPSGR